MDRALMIQVGAESVASLEKMQHALDTEKIDFETIVENNNTSPSMLDKYDLLFCFTFGVLGTIINNSQKIDDFLENIHKDSLITNPKTFFGKLLRHGGTHMDKVPTPNGKKYVNRLAKLDKKSGLYIPEGGLGGPHRIMWGHDILSFGPDNPIMLMINQFGFGKGIIKMFQHLIADTCSTQGLPIPGHSFFDFIFMKSNGNKQLGNRLLDFCKKINNEVGNSNNGVDNKAFNQFFSIKAQDVMAKGLTFGLCMAYMAARGIKDKLRRTQIQLIATMVNFVGTVVWGIAKYGVPTVNWIALGSMVKLTVQLCVNSYGVTMSLQRITTEIVASNVALERRVLETGQFLPTHTDPWDYIDDYLQEQQRAADFINFLEEEEEMCLSL